MKDNSLSVARACAGKWPRVLTIQLAAAYVGELAVSFKRSPYAALIRTTWNGREVVDREELDIAITNELASKAQAQQQGARA